MVDKERVKELLGKLGRTEREFEELLKLYVLEYNDKANATGIIRDYFSQYYDRKNEKYLFPVINYEIMAQKIKKVIQDVSVMKLPDDAILKELMGEEAMDNYKKRIEQSQSLAPKASVKMAIVEQEVPITIYVNFDTGLYVAQAEIYKNFLYNKKLYSFNRIANFLGLELNVKEIGRPDSKDKDIYMIFIKTYNEMEYFNIND